MPFVPRSQVRTAGQVNAFFRWRSISDSAEKYELSLYLVNAAKVKTQFEIPKWRVPTSRSAA
jgi:hypothetical protein